MLNLLRFVIQTKELEWAKKTWERAFYCLKKSRTLFESGSVDGVIIATPHYYHPPLAIEAFKSGLHVLIEKPAGVYTKQVREMNEAAEKSGKVFGIMYNQRTNFISKTERFGEIR